MEEGRRKEVNAREREKRPGRRKDGRGKTEGGEGGIRRWVGRNEGGERKWKIKREN